MIIASFLRIIRAYKWYAAILATVLALVAWIRNLKKYRGSMPTWLILLKTYGDLFLMLALATIFPPLLIALCVTWVMSFVKTRDMTWKTIIGTFAGLGVFALGQYFLEVILIVGVFAMDQVTGKFIHYWSEGRELPFSRSVFSRADRN